MEEMEEGITASDDLIKVKNNSDEFELQINKSAPQHISTVEAIICYTYICVNRQLLLLYSITKYHT